MRSKKFNNWQDLPVELRKDLESTPPLSWRQLEDLRKANEGLQNAPSFLAEVEKGLFIEHMLEAMEASGQTKNELARKWGKTKQYISKLLHESKRVNFTIETMVELAHLLGRRLKIVVLEPGESVHVSRSIPSPEIVRAQKKLTPRNSLPKKTRQKRSLNIFSAPPIREMGDFSSSTNGTNRGHRRH